MGKVRKDDPFLFDLILTADESTPIPDIHDDIAREQVLLDRATAAAKTAHEKVTALSIAFFRPPGISFDPFKSEELLSKVSKRKEEEEKAAKDLERIKREREQKRFAKKMASEAKVVKQQRDSKGKKELELLRRQKKSLLNKSTHGSNNDFGGVQVSSGGEDDDKGKRRMLSSRPNKKNISAKRNYKNEKYGFGPKMSKRNTRQSLDEGLDAFSTKRMKAPFNSKVKKSSNRPGKQRRLNIRSKKASKK